MTPTVAYDATPLVTVRTGIGRSVAEVLGALQAMDDGPRLVPYVLGARAHRYLSAAPPGARTVPVPLRPALELWGRTDHPRVDRWLRGADVVHATNFVVPPSRLPAVVTVHDCSFELFPETVNSVVATFGPVLRRALRRGAVAHVTTEQVAREVEDLYGPGLRSAGQIAVVPFGVPRVEAALPPEPHVQALVSAGPFVLALGRSEPRKNLPLLVRAFGAVRGGVRLLVAGPDGPDRPAVEAARDALPPEVRDRVHVLGMVGEGSRRLLLERAALVVYPSLYEGFGFPVLEAMTLGVPVLASDLPVLREVAGDAAAFADALDPDALGAALAGLLEDEPERARLAAAGRSRAAGFTWQRTAEGLAALYRRVAAS